MRVLALDLASRTGWAVGSLREGCVGHGVTKLPETEMDSLGWFLEAFDEWLGLMIEEFAPKEIVFESPVLPAQTTLPVLRKLYGLAGQTEVIARRYKVRCCEAHLSSIRTNFIGVPFAPKSIVDKRIRRIWVKERIIQECRDRGFHVADDNDADAIALLALRLSHYQKGHRLVQAVAA